MLLAGGLLLALAWPSGSRALPDQPAVEAEPSASQVAWDFCRQLGEIQPSTADDPGEQAESEAKEPKPAEAPSPTQGPEVPATAAGQEGDTEIAERVVPAAEDPPAAAEKTEEPAAPKPIKRRRLLSEEDLRSQLARMPEVRSFTMESMAALVKAYYEGMKFSGGDWNGALEPNCLLRQRPDLANLPVRSGSASRLDRKARASLEALAKKLHAYVDTTIGKEKPDPTWLREALRSEKRGRRPEWLRPEAIPVLLQLLMHEAAPVRALLVEILAEIDGKAATTALAQRAVFDLAPEVRQVAVQALANRRREDRRPVLLQALRYPWAPAADHAAEALVALEDRDVVLPLVAMLKKPDPTAPTTSGSNRPVTRELVRINHRTNCLMCHPPAVRGRDPVTDMVPGVSLHLPESNFRMLAMCKETGRLVVNPLLVRADVTFLRQDFSVRQSTILPGAAAAVDLRFDYLVRTRPARTEELARQKDRTQDATAYEQREAVLFALRELTGQDPGPTMEAWQKLFPQAEAAAEAIRLANGLIRAPVIAQERLLEQYKKNSAGVYTQALAVAIPRLKGYIRDRARQGLAERLAHAQDATLEAELRDENAEIRQAAARACILLKAQDRMADLIGLLEDGEPGVVQAAHAALKDLSGQDFGPGKDRDTAQAIAAWKEWWAKQAGE
jgi:hypothetical protein